MDLLTEVMKYRNEENSIKMSSYMRNKFNFLGVKRPERKIIEKEIFKNFKNCKEIDTCFVVEFFRQDYREFQYIAIDYLIKMRKYFKKEHIFLLEKLICEKSWWDTVDIIASNLVGEICKMYPQLINEVLIDWINRDNIWIRRSSIIFQLRYKELTNLSILKKSIEDNINDNEFFIQKAIGWSLREYSKTNIDWVLKFLNDHSLTPLVKREAMKYANKMR